MEGHEIKARWKKFIFDALIRAVRTMAQTALAGMTVGATVSEVAWGQVLSASAVAGVYSVLMSLDRIETTQNGENGAQAVPVTGMAKPLPDELAPQNDGKAGKL